MAADVMVLGAGGTFGHAAAAVLSRSFEVVSAARTPGAGGVAFDARACDDELTGLLSLVKPGGLAVNAAAVLASEIAADTAAGREQAIAVNALFPNRLARLAARHGIRILHVSTDAVFATLSGRVTESDPIGPEDFYGVTKAAGELTDPHCITVRCSIVGPSAPSHRRGLWAWVAGQEKGAVLRGYVNQSWAGLTTLQLAAACAKLVDPEHFAAVRREAAIHHLVPNPPVSKYEIVQALAAVLRPDLTVEPSHADKTITRALTSRYATLDSLTPHFATWTDAVAAATGCNR
jgi:dTDP-4-dehydrorhamnose reductase